MPEVPAELLRTRLIGDAARGGGESFGDSDPLRRLPATLGQPIGRQSQYRMRSVLDTGARMSFGSDWPVTSPNVLAGIRTAVTRQTPEGMPEGGWQPTERITVTEALTAATRGVAYQARAEEFRGRLGPGDQADMVWLSADPRTVPPADLADVKVCGTWRRGRRTY